MLFSQFEKQIQFRQQISSSSRLSRSDIDLLCTAENDPETAERMQTQSLDIVLEGTGKPGDKIDSNKTSSTKNSTKRLKLVPGTCFGTQCLFNQDNFLNVMYTVQARDDCEIWYLPKIELEAILKLSYHTTLEVLASITTSFHETSLQHIHFI